MTTPATPSYTRAELTARQRWADELGKEHPGWNIRLDPRGAFTAARGPSTVTGETMHDLENGIEAADAVVDGILAAYEDI